MYDERNFFVGQTNLFVDAKIYFVEFKLRAPSTLCFLELEKKYEGKKKFRSYLPEHKADEY